MPRERKLDPRPIYFTYVKFDWMGIPFYVGKGGGHPNRDTEHEKKSDESNWLKDEIIERTWIMLGEVPTVRVRDKIPEKDAFITEIALIATIGRMDQGKGPLVNRTDGGDGAAGHNVSIQGMKAISKSVKEWWATLTPKERSNFAKSRVTKSFEELSKIAKERIGNRTPEQLSISAQKGVATRRAKGILPPAKPPRLPRPPKKPKLPRLTHEQLSELAKQREARKTPEQKQAQEAKRLASGSFETRSLSAKKREAKRTLEEQKERMKKVSAGLTIEKRKEAAKKAWITRRNQSK